MITLPPAPQPKVGPMPKGYQLLPDHMKRTTFVLVHDKYWSSVSNRWMDSNFPGEPFPERRYGPQDVYIRRKKDFKIQAGTIGVTEP